MTDLEITKLCAEAMGLDVTDDESGIGGIYFKRSTENPASRIYRPLNNDAQAMALVKRFALSIGGGPDGWECWFEEGQNDFGGFWNKSDSLNRAICICVANMQAEQ